MRTLYKILSILSAITAFSRGRGGRYMVRRYTMRRVARSTRRIRF